MSRFGRPKGARDPAFSLRHLVAPLSRAIGGRAVVFAEDRIGDEAKRVVSALRQEQVALSKTFASAKRKKRTRPISRALLPNSETFTSTMPFRLRTAPTLRSTRWRGCTSAQARLCGVMVRPRLGLVVLPIAGEQSVHLRGEMVGDAGST